MARQMTAQTDPFVDPAALAADVFNVDFSLTSADALIAQLQSAVPLGDERNISRRGGTQEPAPARLRIDAGPYATAAVAAQVLQEAAAQLSQIEPFEAATDEGCDYRTIVAQVRSSVAAIAKELNKPEPLGDLVELHLEALTSKPDGDLDLLRRRLGVDGAACSVKDERTRTVFSSVAQFTKVVGDAWQEAKNIRPTSLTAAMYSLQRSLRAMVVTAEELRQKVPSSAWITYQIQDNPPLIAWDLYQWIHDQASAGALSDLKHGGRRGIHRVHETMTHIKTLVETKLRVEDPAAGGCSAAFADKDVQVIVEELICHMKHVVDVTNDLLPPPQQQQQ